MSTVKLVPLHGKYADGRSAIVDAADYLLVTDGGKWFHGIGGYAIRSGPNRTTQSIHRLVTNAPEGLQVDHINGDKLDNRRSNLRVCTASQNKGNTPPYANSTSQYRGVSWNIRNEVWQVKIRRDGKLRHVGHFQDEVQAAKAYDRAARQVFGEFAWLNFPDEIEVESMVSDVTRPVLEPMPVAERTDEDLLELCIQLRARICMWDCTQEVFDAAKAAEAELQWRLGERDRLRGVLQRIAEQPVPESRYSRSRVISIRSVAQKALGGES